MTLVRGLYERFRQLIHEAAKFGVVGAFGVLITNGCYDLLHNGYHVGPVTSTTIATIIATVFSYVANRYWSFRHRERTNVARETAIFFVLNGVGLLIQDAVVAFNYYILDNQHDKLAGFIALNLGIALATLFRFWSYRRWVWAAPPDGAASPVPQPEPAGSPLPAHLAAWDQVSGDEQARDLQPANGHTNGRPNGRANGRTGHEHASRTGPQAGDR